MYEDEFLRAKLMLIEVSRQIKLNETFNHTKSKLNEVFSIFNKHRIIDGEADCNFLRGV